MTLDGSHAPQSTDTAERAAIEAMDAAGLQRVKDQEWNAAIEAAVGKCESYTYREAEGADAWNAAVALSNGIGSLRRPVTP